MSQKPPPEDPMKDALRLPLLLAITGAFVTAVHDYAYRRVGGDDYELYGLVSHAGSDMIIVTIALVLVAVAWGRMVRR